MALVDGVLCTFSLLPAVRLPDTSLVCFSVQLGALPQLKSLALSGPVTHVGISALADALRTGGAPRLEGLYLWDTPGLSQEEASLKLARALTEGACPLMKEFGGNPSEAALELLRARGPTIQVI